MIFRAESQKKFLPTWFWILLLGLPLMALIGCLIWRLLYPSNKRLSAVEIETDRKKPIPLKIPKDDFMIIKGIGPKTAAALPLAGIFSYEQLGLIHLDQLEEILRNNSLPTSPAALWQQQASLAAVGDLEGMNQLQNS